ncbi:MAG: PQQ-binding-like beta-propeller repeat protein [Cyclobacteriaceae bacterium]
MKNNLRSLLTIVTPFLSLISCQTADITEADMGPEAHYQGWSHYLGDPARTHYSSLGEINRDNVQDLEVAWTYASGDIGEDNYMQCNPLVVDTVLYGASPGMKIFAVQAATGEPIWEFNPYEGTDHTSFTRGLSYWTDGEDHRLFVTAREKLYAIDALTGKPVSGFGGQGYIDLREGLGRDIAGLSYTYLSPGTVYQDLIIMGALNSERFPAAPGHIRAFNVRTGEQAWIFHTIPQPGQEGYDSWEDSTAYRFIGGVNNWTGMTLDEERGIVFAPLGSASFDFYGGNRKGANLYANSLVALDAQTGEKRWHFQTVHHDIWDRDLPAPPTLVTVEHEGERIDAVAQVTKSGYVYVFNRETGESLFPIEEQPYPESDLIGEVTWPTQPLPTQPPPFSRQNMTAEDINPHSRDRDSLLAVFESTRSGGQFVPPSVEGTIIFPGLDGGGEWGGAGYDPVTGVLYVNANELPWILRMIEQEPEQPQNLLALGLSVYQSNCMACHGAELEGSTFHGQAPELVNLAERMDEAQVHERVREGQGAMPSFAFLSDTQIDAVAAFLLKKEGNAEQLDQAVTPQETGQLRYSFAGYKSFSDADGYPAVKPPWGTLNAIDLNKGEILWQVPLGEFPELTEQGIPKTGTNNYGGPVVTAGGLIFIAATQDAQMRAFNSATGEELWQHALPAAGMATPCTYEVDGKQYIVIAAGGGKITQKHGDQYVAFALPDQP